LAIDSSAEILGDRTFPAGIDGELPPAGELDSTDPALILYTSGTTGEQKGAVLSHGTVLSNIQATNHHTGMGADDVVLCFLPLFHCFGQNFVLNATLNAGGTLILHKRFELAEILGSLRKNRVTMFFSIPPNYHQLLELPDISPFETVRYFFTAADTMPPETAEKWFEKYGRRIWEGWGLTETSPFATYNHDTHYKPGTVGTPIVDVEVKIAGGDGEWLEAGEVGEIAVSGPNVFQGYFHDPEATRRVFRDGCWFLTGDIGKLDEDGYLQIVDRKNDRIKVIGFSVWPREIEKFLREHFAGRIEDVGIIGVPDEVRGEMPFAYVVARDPTLTEFEITEACRRKLAGYQQLKEIKFVDRIPKTPTGKILKRELRDWQARP
jgi:long-chain acyl-CoA synthetase